MDLSTAENGNYAGFTCALLRRAQVFTCPIDLVSGRPARDRACIPLILITRTMMSLYSARVGKLVRTKQAVHHAREVAMIVLDALDQRGVALDRETVDALVDALARYFETWPTRFE